MYDVESLPRTTPEVAVKFTTVETPTHLFAWLPFVWTRVLFAGPVAPVVPWRWKQFALLFVLSGTLLYPCLSFHLFEPDEGRYAQIPREMLTRGGWIVPSLQGESYLDKPPLMYWLIMLSYSVCGCHDWAARLIPALAMQATVLMTYLIGRRLVGERSAFWGALLLTVSPIFLGIGRLLVLDGLLTLWVTIAVLTAYRPASAVWWIVAAIACGLGVLTKGPVALVLVMVPLAAHRRLTSAPPISRRGWVGFFAIAAATCLPWYVAICCQRSEFLGYFLWQHNVERFTDPFDHIRPVWFYVPIVLFGILPVLLLTRPLLRFLTSLQPNEIEARCPALGYLLLAGSWCVFFFSLAGSKLPTYILPAFPLFCLSLGCFVARMQWHRSRLLIGLVIACWLLLACSHYVLIPAYARQKSPAADLEMLRATCADVPVFCFPRNVDSAAFYLGRDDFRTFRSKQLAEMIDALDEKPRTVILFGHRNSPETLRRHLPAHLRMTDRQPLGLCEMAVIERVSP